MSELVKICPTSEVADNSVKSFEVGNNVIAVYNLGGTFYATDNECTHAYAMLTDGTVDGEVIVCPLHGGAFEIKTGKGLGAPIFCDVKCYPTRVSGANVEVQVD